MGADLDGVTGCLGKFVEEDIFVVFLFLEVGGKGAVDEEVGEFVDEGAVGAELGGVVEPVVLGEAGASTEAGGGAVEGETYFVEVKACWIAEGGFLGPAVWERGDLGVDGFAEEELGGGVEC